MRESNLALKPQETFDYELDVPSKNEFLKNGAADNYKLENKSELANSEQQGNGFF